MKLTESVPADAPREAGMQAAPGIPAPPHPDPYAELASLLTCRGFTPEDVARELYPVSRVLAAPIVAAMEAAQRDGAMTARAWPPARADLDAAIADPSASLADVERAAELEAGL